MFWKLLIPSGTLGLGVLGFFTGGWHNALFMGVLGLLTIIAVMDYRKFGHNYTATTLLLGVLGLRLGGLFLGLGTALVGFLVVVALIDYFQTTHAIRRNFPLIGWVRYISEAVGDEFRQYWFMNNREELPYPRWKRRYIYRSAKGVNNNLGFGTEQPYRDIGQIHILPGMFPVPDREMANVLPPIVIGPNRRKPYHCPWPINISGMSWGALSEEAVRALSSGGKLANIHMSTGEGGLTPFHLDGVVKRAPANVNLRWKVREQLHKLSRGLIAKPQAPVLETIGGARIVQQLGAAKFGFRKFFMTPSERGFEKVWSNELDWEKLEKTAGNDQIVAFEVKLAQGAKPGQGGKLPKEKITPELAEWRGIEMGVDCYSPNAWDEFHDVPSLFAFIVKMQEVTGKPVGIKIVAGQAEFIRQIAEEMKKTGNGPDFITVDGGEGGTGAAPVALADMAGLPILHAIPLVDKALRDCGVRDKTVIVASGQIATGGDVAVHIAMGADMVNIGRGFLLAEGCIMALRCHTNKCPVGITTQDPRLRRGFDPQDKYVKVANYAMVLQKELIMILKSCGVRTPWELTRHHISVVRQPMVEEPLATLYPYTDGSNGKRNPVLGPLPEPDPANQHTLGPKLVKLGVNAGERHA
ncbi:MAG TPA: FMN-binding glutamate synthase family protein [Oculatellaceae cyanobacterium]